MGANPEAEAGLKRATTRFSQNVEAVRRLSNLDRDLLAVAVESLNERDARLIKAGVDNQGMLAGNTLSVLENIRQHDSLRPGFLALVSQCVVLLCSYFSSGVSDVFRAAIPLALVRHPTEKLLEHDLRLKVRDVQVFGFDLEEQLADLLAEASGISFQDMKSIARAFGDYLETDIERDAEVNDLIAGLACRHAIVHSGGVVDRACVRQLQVARPRTLKESLVLRDQIQFDTEEVHRLADTMERYVGTVARRVAQSLQVPS